MPRMTRAIALSIAAAGLAAPHAAQAQFTVFSTDGPDLRMGVATRSETVNAVENEAADDFVLTVDTRLTSAKIIGLIPANAAISDVQHVTVQIYRLFPLDSNTVRTPQVPTRTNSPSDNALLFRDSVDANLSFVVGLVGGPATTQNTVVNGLNPLPAQTTGGEGPVTGQEVAIEITFNTPIDLRPGHYFFVPQVTLTNGNFLWASSARPIIGGTQFTPDLQAWIRSGRLFPDWLRVGTDIVGGNPAPTFNMSFLLRGLTLCYPNCDESAAPPVLNVADFTCFLGRFAQGDPRANCDQSTTAPTLNIADFTCFLTSFARGCP